MFIILYIVSVASVVNISAQVNNIAMLNGTNFKVYKEAVDEILDCMGLDIAVRTKQSIPHRRTQMRLKLRSRNTPTE